MLNSHTQICCGLLYIGTRALSPGRGHLRLFAVIPNFIPIRQGLPMSLNLGWQSSNSQGSFITQDARSAVTQGIAFYISVGNLGSDLMLAQKVFYLINHLSSSSIHVLTFLKLLYNIFQCRNMTSETSRDNKYGFSTVIISEYHELSVETEPISGFSLNN